MICFVVWSAVQMDPMSSSRTASALLGGQASIHSQGLASDEGRAGAAQPEHGCSNLVGPADPADGMQARQETARVRHGLCDALKHLGLDRAGQHGVGSNALG